MQGFDELALQVLDRIQSILPDHRSSRVNTRFGDLDTMHGDLGAVKIDANVLSLHDRSLPFNNNGLIGQEPSPRIWRAKDMARPLFGFSRSTAWSHQIVR